jgi:RsiW-degrading membrane proteinase PrsW (M82 family)
MNRIVRHVALPALAPAMMLGLYFTPLTVVSCTTRGLLARGVVLVSAAAAFVAIGFALRARRRNDPSSAWWIVSAAILTAPLALVLGSLG